jgi:hypothetical protein
MPLSRARRLQERRSILVSEPALKAARTIARRVEALFAERMNAARGDGEQDLGPQPDAATVETLVEVAFWASLRREEGHAPTISLALVPPDRAGRTLRLERALPLTPESLTRLSPAVERPGIHLGVWRTGDALSIWGATRTVPPLSFVLEVVTPGVLVVKHTRRDNAGKYVNVVVLDGDRIKVIAERASLPDCPPVVTSLRAPGLWNESVNVLVQLALSMRAHRRGGTLLIVPRGSDAWLESVVRPMTYAVSPAFAGLADRIREADDADPERTIHALSRAVEAVAGLTAVDGATILNDAYELLAFGAKIVRPSGRPQVEQIVLTEPIEGMTPEVVRPSDLGGTRHLSAAQFVQDQPSALGLVASQDGHFTVFTWSPCQAMIHAHRVESLLL